MVCLDGLGCVVSFFFRGKEIDDDVVMMKWEHDGVFYFGGYKLYELIYLKRNILYITLSFNLSNAPQTIFETAIA